MIYLWQLFLFIQTINSYAIIASTEPVVDGSGAVTGMAFHHLRYELDTAKMEKEELNKKYVKYMQEARKEK